jgi:hypothetical protein
LTCSTLTETLSRLPLAFRIKFLASLLAACSVALPVRAQLPIVTDESEATPAGDAPPLTPPAEPPAPPSPPAAPDPTRPEVVTPAKAEVIKLGAPPIADDDDDDDRPLEPRRVWYGWQTLVVDGAAFSTLLIGAVANGSSGSGDGGSTLVGIGLLGYEFGPGIVHFVHRNPGRGFASFGVRLGLPLAGAVLGASLSSNCDGYRCEEGGAGAGLILGMLGAIALDAAVFAYDTRKPPPRGTTTTLMPVASLLPGRAWLGVAGSL